MPASSTPVPPTAPVRRLPGISRVTASAATAAKLTPTLGRSRRPFHPDLGEGGAGALESSLP